MSMVGGWAVTDAQEQTPNKKRPSASPKDAWAKDAWGGVPSAGDVQQLLHTMGIDSAPPEPGCNRAFGAGREGVLPGRRPAVPAVRLAPLRRARKSTTSGWLQAMGALTEMGMELIGPQSSDGLKKQSGLRPHIFFKGQAFNPNPNANKRHLNS